MTALIPAWVTWVAVISIAVGVMTYPLVNFLARRVGKKPLLLGACITYVLLYFAIYQYRIVVRMIGGPAFAVAIGLVIAFPIAITNIIPSSIFADPVQYDSIRTGQDRAGMFFVARNFSNKLCQAMVAIACSLLLGTGTDGTGAATTAGIRNTALVAMIFVAASVMVYIIYDDQEIVRTIREHTEPEVKTGKG